MEINRERREPHMKKKIVKVTVVKQSCATCGSFK